MSDSPPSKRPRLNDNVGENKKKARKVVTFFHLLNDDCLLRMFNELEIKSFCCLAKTDSNHFRKVAEKAFVQRFRHFELEKESFSKNTIRCVLMQFGHLITSMDTFNFKPIWQPWLSQSIAKNCTNSMEKLFLHNMLIDCDAMKQLISGLTVLELNCCQFVGNVNDLLTNCPQLETFYFDSVADADFVAQTFPKLTNLAFDGREWKTLVRVLRLNPQIKTLHAICLPDDRIISIIVRHLSNVESLFITPGITSVTPKFRTSNGLLKLTELKMLKHLSLDAGNAKYSKLASRLVKQFCVKKVNLESLHLSNFRIISKDIVSIQEIKTIKTLSLHNVEVATVDDFIALANQLPLLEELHLQFEYNAKVKISPVDLHNIIQYAGRLTYLGISQVRQFQFGLPVYNSLLEVVGSRNEAVKLTINICGCKITNSTNVPKNVQRDNQSLLDIKFESWDCKCIYCSADID